MSTFTLEKLDVTLSKYPYDKDKLRTFIETGLGRATTIMAMMQRKFFKDIFSIELSPQLYERGYQFLDFDKRIHFYLGDSAMILPKLLLDINEPAIIRLDAHYYKDALNLAAKYNFPLLKELEVVSLRPFPDVIIVDDTDLFGKDNETTQALKVSNGPEWAWFSIDKVLYTLNKNTVINHFTLEDDLIIFRKDRSFTKPK